ncbi:MAG: SDR family oxidoreductase [Prolixibacteraceae bacterium]|jgi:farnesol dehydrogenase
MKCFVTGSNGFIGSRLVEKLGENGHEIKCLVRSPEKFGTQNNKNIQPIYGDLDNLEALSSGTKDCDVVFHLAAYAKPWSKDPDLSHKINVQGTINLLEASLKNKVKKFIFTSSAAVFGPSPENRIIDELVVREITFFNDYESTKAMAETEAIKFIARGLPVVILNPTRVYGPGPLNASNSVTKIIKLYQMGKWHVIPGEGSKIGNYAFINDVVDGHLKAADSGKPGERYILGGENLSFDQFFGKLGKITGKKPFLVNIPVWLMLFLSGILESQAKITGLAPPITPSWVKKYYNHWNLASEKAINELEYHITPFEAGVQKTLEWLNSNKRNV